MSLVPLFGSPPPNVLSGASEPSVILDVDPHHVSAIRPGSFLSVIAPSIGADAESTCLHVRVLKMTRTDDPFSFDLEVEVIPEYSAQTPLSLMSGAAIPSGVSMPRDRLAAVTVANRSRIAALERAVNEGRR